MPVEELIFVVPVSLARAELVEHKQRSTEAPGEPPALASDEIALVLSPTWSQSGQVLLRHDEPVPLTVVSLTAEVALGG